ncbi:hypothetical protein tb265_22420 [Gemmatimonadetes bacterium T265]|nr:hypothetical protein tb265_22420 [Gemmatimonadetes bacterium T265]
MPTPYESARLNLQLYDLRREPVLREARAWFLAEFHPDTFEELVALVSGPRNGAFRMVAGYWDMAASLVTSGAVDAPSFLAAHGEIVAAFALVHPFVAQLRAATGEPAFLCHVEQVIATMPDAEATLARRRAVALAVAAARRAT